MSFNPEIFCSQCGKVGEVVKTFIGWSPIDGREKFADTCKDGCPVVMEAMEKADMSTECYACGTKGATIPVEVEGGHKLICEGECTWPESEGEVLETLTEEEFAGMMKLEAGGDEFAAWLNSKDPIKAMHNC